MNNMNRVASLLLLLFLAGCCSTNHVAVREFQHKHPGEFKKYAYILPIKLDTYRALVGERQAAVSGVISGMKQKFGNVQGVNDYAEEVFREEGAERRSTIELYRKLEGLSENGGAICQFEWSDGKTKEIGLLVLKSGEIIERLPWLADLSE